MLDLPALQKLLEPLFPGLMGVRITEESHQPVFGLEFTSEDFNDLRRPIGIRRIRKKREERSLLRR